MIVDHINHWNTYSLGSTWEQVFKFLSELSPDAEAKEYPIDGDQVFARVMSYHTREDFASDAVLESHRNFADIHMSLVGSERIAVWPTEQLTVKTPYDAQKDAEFYQFQQSAALQIGMEAGTFALLLPQDAHMPALHTGTPGATVKKVVVKIALERLGL